MQKILKKLVDYFGKENRILVLTLAFLVAFSFGTYAFATPPATPFYPGETNDPSCAPGVPASKCYVDVFPDQSATPGYFLESVGGVATWVNVAPGSGIASINGDSTSIQTIVTGAGGTNFAINTSGGVTTVSLPVASGTNTGKLSSADWTTFNSKLSSVVVDAPLTGSGTSGSHLSMPAATSSVNGYLTSADWTTFNNKGSGTVTSVGVTTANGVSASGGPITGSGSFTFTLGAITPTTVNGITFSGSSSPSLAVTGTSSISGTNTGDQTITLTGDVTGSGTGSFATTIGSNKVTNGMLAQMGAHTFKGNNTGGTANALDLTATQLTAELNAMVGDSGSGGTKGLVPAPAAGDAAANKFLKADGTWAVTSGGTVTSVTGTTNRITSTGGATPQIDISASYVGQSSINTLGTITTGTLSTGAIIGGVTMTLGSDATGDMYYRNSSGVLTRLAIGGAHTVLHGGTTAPSYSAVDLSLDTTGILGATNGGTGQSSYAVGDLLYASTTTALSKLADVASGSCLKSGGVGGVPAWGACSTVSPGGTDDAIQFNESGAFTGDNTNFVYSPSGTTFHVGFSGHAYLEVQPSIIDIGDMTGAGNRTEFIINDGGSVITSAGNTIYTASPGLSKIASMIDTTSADLQFGDISLTGNHSVLEVKDATQTLSWNKPNITIDAVPYVFPSSQGGSGTVLRNNGSGNLSWVAAATGTVTSVATDATLTGGPITTTGTLGINLANSNTWTAAQIIDQSGLGTSQSNALKLQNSTAAALGAQQISPSLELSGNGWRTGVGGASRSVSFRLETVPVQGTTNPTGALQFDSAILGSYTNNIASISNTGAFTAADLITGSNGLTVVGTTTLSSLSTGIIHANSSGVLSSSAVALGSADVSGTLAATNGGTGQNTYTTGDLLYASSSSVLSKLADVATGSCLMSGGVGTAPAWSACLGNSVTTNATLTGAGTSGSPLAIALTNSNTWTPTAGTIFQQNGIGTTPTMAALLENSTASSGGATVQESPALEFKSHMWQTTGGGSDHIGTFRMYEIPTSGSAPGTTAGTLQIDSSKDGTYTTNIFSIGRTGNITNAGSITATNGINSTSGSVTAAAQVQAASDLLTGTNGGTAGHVYFYGGASGNLSIAAPSAVTNYTMFLPGAQGGANTFMRNDGAGNLAWNQVDLTTDVTGTLPVTNGGTGATTFTPTGLLVGNGTSAVSAIAVGTTGQCLSGVTGSNPTWTPCGGGGLSFSSGVTLSGSNVTNDLITGISGPQTILNSFNSNDNMTIQLTNSNIARTAFSPAFDIISSSSLGASTAGTQIFSAIDSNINQSGFAGYSMLQVTANELGVGSGQHLLLDLKRGTASEFRVDSSGNANLTSSLTIGVAVPNGILNAGATLTGIPATTGAYMNLSTSTFNDTSASLSVNPVMVFNSIGAYTLSPVNPSVTTSSISAFNIAGAPTTTESSNASYALSIGTVGLSNSIVNSYGLFVNAQSGAQHNYAATFRGGAVGVGTQNPVSLLGVDAGFSGDPAVIGSGFFSVRPNTYTDTVSGAVTNLFNAASIWQPTLASSNGGGTTTGAASSLYISGAPAAGTNETITSTAGLTIASSPVSAATTDSYGLVVNGQTGAINNYAAIFQSGNVGIGTASPNFLLTVGSNAVVGVVARFINSSGTCDINPTTTALVCSSDERLKKDIVSMPSSLDLINRLNPVTYKWNTQTDDTIHPGFVAQQLEAVIPNLVSTDANGFKAVAYSNLTPYLTKAIQELDVKIEPLTSLDPNQDGSLASLMLKFLKDAVVNIKEATIGTLHIDNKVCADDVCVTKDQFKTMLQNASGSSGSGGGTTTTGGTTTSGDGTATTGTTGESTATSGDSTTTTTTGGDTTGTPTGDGTTTTGGDTGTGGSGTIGGSDTGGGTTTG